MNPRITSLVLAAAASVACASAPTDPGPVPSSILSPAVFAAQGCPVEDERGAPIEPGELVDVFAGHLPRRLPVGFGLLHAWGSAGSEDPAGAIWADQKCRTVTLRAEIEAGARGEVGLWSVALQRRCENRALPGVQCIEFRGRTDDGTVLTLRTVGLSEEEARGVRDGTPLQLRSS